MISNLHYISQSSHTDNILAACDAGCKWIQLRIKNESPATVLPVAEAVKKICDRYQASLIINDYPQIAVAVAAAGVHVGKLDMTVAAARAITGDKMIVGGTANTLADILQHVQDGASYVGVGPYRFTTTKQNLSPILGLSGYQSILQSLKEKNIGIPVIAIGGILPEDIPALMETGIHGIAVSGLITHATDKQAVVSQIHHQLKQLSTWSH
ncbi:thiamine phosphate synthase [Chitinophaga sp. CC14]|uniref:thiamine phosphate synthase n=1 Tax=Chitinophaga TaxID=79328 RepID=UPI000DBAB81D|nr:thiamine phosphate synthase [Chitinophaga ginsengisegetis]MDR6566079.1 thiamine-phosphate pyrophosphorylase [Chitinophaga ginsengisegetis]MDR6645808.1 thiamine-phosphate pyrophosphorylase [Chitinophaga ginsengisegetis]MDR6651600.1 thiamine-phosphate pyrophosphorylase [Chitinophaga ginsengisegetis]